MNAEHLVTSIIACNGGELIGRTRFQKTVYILSQLGMQNEFSFYYYQFGPFSEDLSFAIDLAKAEHLIKEEERRRDSDLISYSIFSLHKSESIRPDARKVVEQFCDVIRLLAANSATVLELAASGHYLKTNGYADTWEDEVIRRKGRKTEAGRMAKASELLRQLNLI